MPPQPNEFLRAGFDPAQAVAFKTADGLELWAEPMLFTPDQILARDPLAVLVCTIRDQWARSTYGMCEQPTSDIPRIAMLALAHTYPHASPTERDSWLSPNDPDALITLARVGCGGTPSLDRLRIKALSLAACGMGATKMTALEIGIYADWAADNRHTPKLG